MPLLFQSEPAPDCIDHAISAPPFQVCQILADEITAAPAGRIQPLISVARAAFITPPASTVVGCWSGSANQLGFNIVGRACSCIIRISSRTDTDVASILRLVKYELRLAACSVLFTAVCHMTPTATAASRGVPGNQEARAVSFRRVRRAV